MDVRSMCSSSSSVSSDQSDKSKVSGFASRVQSLPSPPLMDTVNQKKGSSLPPITTILSPLHEINPNSLPPPQKQPHHDTSSSSTENLYDKSSNPKSPSRVNYPQPPVQSISQRSSLTSPLLSSSSYSSQSSNDNANTMWSRQPSPHPTSYYHRSFPPPPQPPPPPPSSQYSYTPQSQQPQQQSVRHYPYPSAIYPPAYATSTSYTSSGNNIGDDDDDSPYITQTVEQSIAKMGKTVDHCNQIAHFATQFRDMRTYNQWNGILPQVSESTLTDMINRAFDILNILSGLKGEISSRRSNASQSEIDLIRKQRTHGVSTRSKYRKRSKRAAPPGRCHSCNISETPEWRRGPDGARTLCNACGLHFAKITRKRALSAMQQTEQQQQQVEQQQRQQQEQPQQQQAVSLSDDSNDSDDNISSSMPTPSASDGEKDNNQIEIIDD